MVEKSLYRIAEAAHYLGLSRSMIYQLLDQGLLKKTKVLPVRITIESLRAYRSSIVERDE
jgi:excisionase family DNA binding protein